MRKLRIELVPEPLWGKSLYHLLLPGVWDQIREEHKRKHGAKCEICGSRAKPLYLHERWKYDDKKHAQKLLGFQLLCELCHSIKHIPGGGESRPTMRGTFQHRVYPICWL